MLFVCRGIIESGKAGLRAEMRPAHIEYLAGFVTVLGGPLRGDGGEVTGTMTVFNAESWDAARSRVENDPYVSSGVVSSWTLDEIDPVIWHPTEVERE